MTHDPNVKDRDLEVCTTLLELAAVELATEAEIPFSRQELFDRARDLGGSQVELPELDLLISLRGAVFLKRHPGGRYSLR